MIDFAIGNRVVLCSPTTLFAVLAVVRQAVDNFLIDRRSDEILGAVGALRDQWERWVEPMEKMGRGLASAQKAYDELSGPRTRQFTRQLEKLEMVRDSRRSELRAAPDAPAERSAVVDPPIAPAAGGAGTARRAATGDAGSTSADVSIPSGDRLTRDRADLARCEQLDLATVVESTPSDLRRVIRPTGSPWSSRPTKSEPRKEGHG